MLERDPQFLQESLVLYLGGLRPCLRPSTVCTHLHSLHAILRGGLGHHAAEFLAFLEMRLLAFSFIRSLISQLCDFLPNGCDVLLNGRQLFAGGYSRKLLAVLALRAKRLSWRPR